MTEKRLIVDEDYNWVDTTTGMCVGVEDAFDLVDELAEENEQLKNRLDENAQLQKETLQQVIGKLGMEILELKDDLKKKSDVE